jgi:lipid IVA palmitoyltransferase
MHIFKFKRILFPYNAIHMKLSHLVIICSIFHSNAVFAEDFANPSLWSNIQDSLSQTWQSQNYELYIPVNTWHNRSFYSSEKINSFNEQPWGIGVGKYQYDADGDWNALFGMVFLDSHNRWEPIVGYGFEKTWRPNDEIRLGAGYTVGFTMRQDMHYVPIPIILPLVSVEYKQIAVQSTYVPGGNGNGNILFTWLRWQW